MSKRCHPGDDDGSSKRYKGTTREFAWVRNEQRGKILDSQEKERDELEKFQKSQWERMDAVEEAIGYLLKVNRKRRDGTHDESFAVFSSIFQWWLERKQRRERVGSHAASAHSEKHLEDGFVGVDEPAGMWQDVERSVKIIAKCKKIRHLQNDVDERTRGLALFTNAMLQEMAASGHLSHDVAQQFRLSV